jgi:hypothetical protein
MADYAALIRPADYHRLFAPITTAHRLVQCGATIDARHGTSDPDNSYPATKPQLAFDLDAAGGFGCTASYSAQVFEAKS